MCSSVTSGSNTLRPAAQTPAQSLRQRSRTAPHTTKIPPTKSSLAEARSRTARRRTDKKAVPTMIPRSTAHTADTEFAPETPAQTTPELAAPLTTAQNMATPHSPSVITEFCLQAPDYRLASTRRWAPRKNTSATTIKIKCSTACCFGLSHTWLKWA